MKTRIGQWLGFYKSSTSPEAGKSRDNPLTIEDGSENATRRQLVQVLLRDVLRKSGIPPHWIECQMLLVSSRTRGHGMYVRLVLKHFDTRFMTYAFAFQQTLLKDIERFEPKAAQWLHGLSWQLDLADSGVYKMLPDKSFWQETLKKPVPPAAHSAQKVDEVFYPLASPPVDDRVDDIERLFAIRDRELARHAIQGLTPVGYEATQPSLLQV